MDGMKRVWGCRERERERERERRRWFVCDHMFFVTHHFQIFGAQAIFSIHKRIHIFYE
jgi:hypothetical protein